MKVKYQRDHIPVDIRNHVLQNASSVKRVTMFLLFLATKVSPTPSQDSLSSQSSDMSKESEVGSIFQNNIFTIFCQIKKLKKIVTICFFVKCIQ